MTGSAPETFSYLNSVEQFYLLLRRQGLMLSPADLSTIERWRALGIPLRVVCQGLLDGQTHYREAHGLDAALPRSIRYFDQAVRRAAARWRTAQSARMDGGAVAHERRGNDRLAQVRRLMGEVAEIGRVEGDPLLREAYRLAYRRLQSIARRLESDEPLDLVAALVATDCEMVERVLAGLGEARLDELRREAARNLEPGSRRLGSKALAERIQAEIESALTRHLGLARLRPDSPTDPPVAGHVAGHVACRKRDETGGVPDG